MPERKEKIERLDQVKIYCERNDGFNIQKGLVPKSHLENHIPPGTTYDKIQSHHLETRVPPGQDGVGGHEYYIVIYPDGRRGLIQFTNGSGLWYDPGLVIGLGGSEINQEDIESFIPQEK